MKRILTLLLFSAIVTSGITACARSNTDTPQSNQPSPIAATAPQSERDQRQEVRKQIAAVLTSEQAQQLKTRMQQGEKMRPALASLNLTDEQKSKIQAILKTSRGQRSTSSQ